MKTKIFYLFLLAAEAATIPLRQIPAIITEIRHQPIPRQIG